ncbi:MAG: winged helix-turn-helix transcriptional regulator [Butyrivibrio sp.]|nr:winged helix-turn-helix transcriptional regulator [Butyrivibrio sp.]
MFDGVSTIKVEFSGECSPYSAGGRYYLRTADEDREVSPEELKVFFGANKYREKWEKGISELTEKQVDRHAVKNFWQNAVTAGRMPEGRYTCSNILKRFGLVKNGFLTHAGEALFGNNHPITLKVGIFATDEKLTILDMKVIEDNIFNLLRLAEEYILSNIRWRVEIGSMERYEIPEVPVAVVREVLANSFAHAIYGGRTTHEICIHPGKITIYSPGEYASKYKPEDYIEQDLESEIRNPMISKILFLNKSIEKFGSGFKRIDSLCKDAGVEYSYVSGENGFKFVIKRNPVSGITNVTTDVTTNVTSESDLNNTEKTILAILRVRPDASRDELAEKTFKTVRTVQRTLNSLREKGYIEREGAKQNTIWKIKK